MLKRSLLSSAIALLLLSSCANNLNYQNLNPAFNTGYRPMPASNNQLYGQSAGTDWFQGLSPELQQYYAPARGKTGRDLFLALNQVIQKGQTVSQYGDAKAYLYATADNFSVQQQSGLNGAYSDTFIPGSGGNGNIYREQGDQNRDGTAGDFINAEHSWPQSFFGKNMPMVADMHHIFPTLSKPNAMRSNFPLGMATGVVVYQTSSGSKLGVVDKTGKYNPADIQRWFNLPWEQQPHDIIDRDLAAVFEPSDHQKGNSARAMLYFYLRYYNQNIRSGAYDEARFWDNNVRSFIQWAQADAVDELETRRHELIAQRQHNRNPFIDIPNLARLIGEDVFLQGP